MKKRFVILCALTLSANASAGNVPGKVGKGVVDVIKEVGKHIGTHDPDRLPQPTGHVAAKFYFAKGEHQCWCDEYAGYFCKVEGSGYTDHNHAFISLKLMDCCSTYVQNEKRVTNARSIDFKLTGFSAYYPQHIVHAVPPGGMLPLLPTGK